MMFKNQKKKTHRTRRLLPLIVLYLLFYGAMLLLTLTAKDIHLARLPKVTASRLQNVTFSYQHTNNGETYTVTKQMPGIPKELYDSGQIFVIVSEVTDYMTCYYAKKISLELDPSKENETYYAVSDSFFRDMVILTGYEELEHGDEVHLLKDNK